MTMREKNNSVLIISTVLILATVIFTNSHFVVVVDGFITTIKTPIRHHHLLLPPSSSSSCRPSTTITTILGMSSSSSSDTTSFDSDDLAKLRKKREEIMAKKRAMAEERTKPQSIPDIPSDYQTPPTTDSTTTNDDNNDVIVDDKSTTPVSSIAPNLPPRPQAMNRAKTRARDRDAPKKTSKKDDDTTPKAIDFLADYPDENDLHIPNRIGFGTMAWGDVKRGFVAEGRLTKKMVRDEGKFLPGDLQVVYNTLVNAGIRYIDTSETYGISSRPTSLSAEHMLGRFSEENLSNSPLLATTFANPYANFLRTRSVRFGKNAVLNALKQSCGRMETSGVELYQIQSVGLYGGGMGALADGLALGLDRGYCNHVGGVDLTVGQMKRFQRKLEKRGAMLTSNQFEFSLTNRRALKNGTLKACKDLGIIPIAHTPLDHGLASGKYTANDPTGGTSSIKYDFKKVLEPLLPLHDAQLRVAKKVTSRLEKEFRDESQRRLRSFRFGPGADFDKDVTPMQVAINYVVAKGAVPIPGVRNQKEAEELLGCLGWGLTEEEVGILDDAAEQSKR